MKSTETTIKPLTRKSRATMENSLRDSELRYRHLFESAQDGILILDGVTGVISDINTSLVSMLGYSREDLLGKKFWEVSAFEDIEASRDSFRYLQKNEFVHYKNQQLKRKEGRQVQVDFTCSAYRISDEKIIQCVIRDIRDRKATEAAMEAKDDARLSMMENQETHGLLIEKLPVGVMVHAPDTRVVLCNPEASQLLGISADQVLGKKACDPEWHYVREDGSLMPAEEFPVNQVIATRQVLKNFVMRIDRALDGESRCVLVTAYPELNGSELLRHVVVIFTDISDIKRAEKIIQRHLEHLTALAEIDRAINFSFDLNLILTTLLTHVIVQLGIDAADVLMFNSTSRTLEYVASRGFHGKAIKHARQPLGKGYAGRAAQERSIVHIPDLAKEHDRYLRGILLAGEKFVSYYGVPLIAKGEVMGVLEVFHRTKLLRNEEWLDFLKALAAQAAIAIENVTLFDNLQRSNTELFHAYNATIEGWSRALELRDNESEGHTHRAAELTVKLARLFGLSDAELVQVRWGALLHDIGKMAIPDDILLKHDKLTEEEWVLMKKHPVFAYEMLSPIRYLRTALDIPYAHHEMWDGSGYPLGLKGEQIPLAARIFAVADVWDALRSDRRYRTSWNVEKVRKHLRSLAGTHFDPHVVNVCLDSSFLVD